MVDVARILVFGQDSVLLQSEIEMLDFRRL
jgi:hypothetical protein